jgi:hypothetical protein
MDTLFKYKGKQSVDLSYRTDELPNWDGNYPNDKFVRGDNMKTDWYWFAGINIAIYFDAFGFPLQPELWSELIFKKMFEALLPNGVLVTYACRTSIKNAMIASGFTIEKLPGAPGKREMLRATKIV